MLQSLRTSTLASSSFSSHRILNSRSLSAAFTHSPALLHRISTTKRHLRVCLRSFASQPTKKSQSSSISSATPLQTSPSASSSAPSSISSTSPPPSSFPSSKVDPALERFQRSQARAKAEQQAKLETKAQQQQQKGDGQQQQQNEKTRAEEEREHEQKRRFYNDSSSSSDGWAWNRARQTTSWSDRMTNIVMTAWILTNAYIYIIWQRAPGCKEGYRGMERENSELHQDMKKHFIASRYNIHQGRYHTMITSGFAQYRLTHLLSNLAVFALFARPVARSIGLRAFCGICIGAPFVASLTALTIDGIQLQLGKPPSAGILGASSTAYCLFGLWILIYQNQTLKNPFKFGPPAIKGRVLLLFGFAILCSELLGFAIAYGLAEPTSDMKKDIAVAYEGHLASFALAGGLYYTVLKRPQPGGHAIIKKLVAPAQAHGTTMAKPIMNPPSYSKQATPAAIEQRPNKVK